MMLKNVENQILCPGGLKIFLHRWNFKKSLLLVSSYLLRQTIYMREPIMVTDESVNQPWSSEAEPHFLKVSGIHKKQYKALHNVTILIELII